MILSSYHQRLFAIVDCTQSKILKGASQLRRSTKIDCDENIVRNSDSVATFMLRVKVVGLVVKVLEIVDGDIVDEDIVDGCIVDEGIADEDLVDGHIVDDDIVGDSMGVFYEK